jgi:hypothetical protein
MPQEMTASRLSRAEQVRERRIKVGGLFGILKRSQGRGGRKCPWRPTAASSRHQQSRGATACWSRRSRGRGAGSGCSMTAQGDRQLREYLEELHELGPAAGAARA